MKLYACNYDANNRTTNNLKIGAPAATLPNVLRYWVSARFGRPCFSML